MERKIDVFSSSWSFREEDVRDRLVVVIDVLRSGCTMHTALENGANGIIPVSENDDPGRFTRNLDSSRILLCGEKDGRKVEGFHLGNSPFEYREEVVRDKTLIFKTSNGTRAITRSHLAKIIVIGSFLNLTALVAWLRNFDDMDIRLVCSGWSNRLSIEDMLFAGAIIYFIYDKKLPDETSDGVKVAFGLYEKYGDNVSQLIASSNHGKKLIEIGFEEDVNYCSQTDLYRTIPVMNNGVIRIKNQ